MFVLEPTVLVVVTLIELTLDTVGFTLVVSLFSVVGMLVVGAVAVLVEMLSVLVVTPIAVPAVVIVLVAVLEDRVSAFVLVVSSTVLLIVIEFVLMSDIVAVVLIVEFIKVAMLLTATLSLLAETTSLVNNSSKVIPVVAGVEIVLDSTAFVVIDEPIVEVRLVL